MFRPFLVLFLLFSIFDAFDSVPICASKDREKDLEAADIHAGLFIELNDNGFDDGKEVDSGGADCEVPLGELDLNLGSVIEMSFSKQSRRDEPKCVELKYKGDFKIFACSATNTSKKIVTFENLADVALLVLADSENELRTKLGVDSQIYIRNVPKEVQPVVKHVVGLVNLDCDYPNPFVSPDLYRVVDGDYVDLTANLTGRNFLREIVGEDEATLKSAAGVYECSWDGEKPTPGNPLRASSKFDVNVYSEQIHCGVDDKTGANLEHDVLINEVVDGLSLSCSLKWAGSTSNAVDLSWVKNDAAVVNVNEGNGGLEKSASFAFTGNVTEKIVFTCRVSNSTIFDGQSGPRAPNACSVTLNPVASLKTDYVPETTGLGAGWIIVIILILIGIAFIIAVACARDNCIMNKLKSLPACAGCIRKLEDMKLISRWGSYKPDHGGSMTTVHTSTSQNDVNKNPTNGDLDPEAVVVKASYDEPPPNPLWGDSDNVSMDTDLTIDEGLFDQNGVKIGRKPKSETGI